MILSCQTTGFKPGDYCVFQLVSITHEIYKSFDKSHEVRGAFLDISKAFDKIWYDVITFKLTQNGISGNLTQRVVLNGHVSTWTIVTAGVPQGSILGPLMFLIYKNISLKDFLLMLSYLQTIHLYFPLFITARLLQMILTRI